MSSYKYKIIASIVAIIPVTRGKNFKIYVTIYAVNARLKNGVAIVPSIPVAVPIAGICEIKLESPDPKFILKEKCHLLQGTLNI